MNSETQANVPDRDLQRVGVALRRAARRARELAAATGTELVVWKDGQIVRENPLPSSDTPLSPLTAQSRE